MAINDQHKQAAYRELIASIDQSGDPAWLQSLESRKQEEATFHDEKVDRHGLEADADDLPERKRANKRFYSTTGKSADFVQRWIRHNTPGRVVLDYACGQGKFTRTAAAAGAAVAIGIDVSGTSIANARADAHRDGLADRALFYQGDCEETRLPDESVDVVICSGMLHHLDVRIAFAELGRIMKPGGVCFAVEALDYNPIVKAYRLLTPSLRTEWEKHHILSHKDLKLAGKHFDVENIRYWHLLSIATTPLRSTPLFGAALGAANAIDSALLKVPPFSYMAWQFTFELRKRAAAAAPLYTDASYAKQAA